MNAFADTNFIVALLDKRDSLHKRASALNDRLVDADAEIFYPDCVINENHQRFGSQVARAQA